MHSEGYSTLFVRPSDRLFVCPSVCLSVCYHVFCRYVQQDGQKVISTGSVNVDKNAAFKSYGVKPSERANMKISTSGLPAYLRGRHHMLQRRASIDSHMLSSSVANL